MNFLPELITIATLHFLALISPGPDFAIVTKNSLLYSKKIGIFSAFGIAIGLLIHVIYSLIGIGLIISKSIVLFTIIKFLGAAYLIYIGIKALKSKKSGKYLENIKKNKELTPLKAFKQGFFTNLLNPKATLFFLSLFTLVISPTTPFLVKLVYGTEMTIVTFVWFAFVAIILSQSPIKKVFANVQNYVEKIMGAILIAVGLKVAVSK